jgi:hypothetical protein
MTTSYCLIQDSPNLDGPQEQGGPVIPPETGFPFRSLSRLAVAVAVAVAVNLRQTVSRPVCPGVRRPSGTCDQFFFLLEISFSQLRVCNFVARSLARGWVCKLLYSCFWVLTAELRWRYSNSPPHGEIELRTKWKTVARPIVAFLLGTSLPYRCVATISSISPPSRPKKYVKLI